MASKPQRIRDPLHNLIEFDESNIHFRKMLWDLIQTPSFQRLRRIKQLGFSDHVYPGATHSRFSHSLGTYHIAKNLLDVIRKINEGTIDNTLAEHAITAALLHDIGHGPFSHAFEEVGKNLGLPMVKHEKVSEWIIRNGDVAEILEKRNKGTSDNVADLVCSLGPRSIYSAVVSSQFDADRLDYMQRDRLMTGTKLGKIDFDWLMSNLEIGEIPWGNAEEEGGKYETFVLGAKSVHAAEAYVLGLFQLYPTVYFHKTTRGIEKFFTKLLERIITLIREDKKNYKKINLAKNHPLVEFAKKSNSIEHLLKLDDTVIMGALPLLSEAKDPLVERFSSFIRERKLYKCIDIWEQLLQKRIVRKNSSLYLDRIERKIKEWMFDKENEDRSVRILLDSGMREPYKQLSEEKGPLNQIMIKTPNGEIKDIREQSPIIDAIQPFNFLRVYISDKDEDAKKFINGLVKEELEEIGKVGKNE